MWTLRHWYLPRKPDNPVPDSVIDNLADIRRLVTLFPYTLPLMEALSVSASSDMGVSTEFDGGSGLFPGRATELYILRTADASGQSCRVAGTNRLDTGTLVILAKMPGTKDVPIQD